MIAGLLLAAGRSSRFGSDKLCATVHGDPVIRLAVRALAELDDVIVVVPDDHASIQHALGGLGARLIQNSERDAGMASSILAGIAALPADAAAIVIALADQPFASAQVTRTLVDRWREGDADIVVPHYTDGRGHPVVFGRRCFEALSALSGDSGARRLFDDPQFRVAEVAIGFPMPLDVDTPELLALAARRATDDASMSPPSV